MTKQLFKIKTHVLFLGAQVLALFCYISPCFSFYSCFMSSYLFLLKSKEKASLIFPYMILLHKAWTHKHTFMYKCHFSNFYCKILCLLQQKEYCVHYTISQYSFDSDLVFLTFLAVLRWKKYLFKGNMIKQKKMLGTLLS